MRILVAHNFYQQRGGEDEVVRTEIALLTAAGHHVSTYFRHNDEIRNRKLQLILLPMQTVWSRQSHSELQKAIEAERPDVVHFHNTLPLISPSAYYACKEQGVAVVQTLHNYRTICPGANLLREGSACEDCLASTLMLPAMLHGCYRESRIATATVAATLGIHRAMNTYATAVHRYIALSEFSRRKFIAGGLPESRIAVKGNSAYPAPAFSTVPIDQRQYALFIGRFSAEKGIRTLAAAARNLPAHIQLRIIGDGPVRSELVDAVRDLKNVSVEPWVPKSQVPSLMQNARLLVCPSECYENFPLAVAEAFACGTPVLCSRMGVHSEIVQDQVNGLHFTPGDSTDLLEKLAGVWDKTDLLSDFARSAKRKSDSEFSAERNCETLLGIYEAAIAEKAAEAHLPVRSHA